jgi:hypothetical protein
VSAPEQQESSEQSPDVGPGHAFLPHVVEREVEPLGDDSRSTGPIDLACECGLPDCDERLELTPALSEAMQRRPSAFVLKPGHFKPELERIVETHPDYVLTETL